MSRRTIRIAVRPAKGWGYEASIKTPFTRHFFGRELYHVRSWAWKLAEVYPGDVTYREEVD